MKKHRFILSLIVLAQLTTATLFAASSKGIIQRMGSSNTELFDDNWLFYRFGLQADGSRIAEAVGVEMTGYNDDNWKKIALPHDWAIEGPFRIDLPGESGKLPYKGIGCYRKYFDVPLYDKGKQFFLDFDGAMANAQVWVNGNYAGGWPYGYTSFRIDVTPFLRYGQKNLVAVKLNTEKWDARWYSGAGIYRHVWLVKTDAVHVAHWGAFVTTPKVSAQVATVKLDLTLENKSAVSKQVLVKTTIFDIDANDKINDKVLVFDSKSVSIDAGKNINFSQEADLSIPRLWDLETPTRYLAQTNIELDGKVLETYNSVFGVRSIEFNHDKGFLLNGKLVKIQGVCNHHDLGALGAAINTSALRRQLTILKEMGCNAIRTSHNPPAPELLELADKMGFLIMDEAFDCWRHGKKKNDYSKLFEEWHERDLAALICRDRNHPSVIMWSTGNEVAEQYSPETGTAQHLTDIVHKYDTTRPATFGASDPAKSAINGTELQVDVHGMNYAAGGYGGPDFYGKFLNKVGHEKIVGYSSESSSTVSSRGEYFFGKNKGNYQVSSYDLLEPGWGALPDQEFRALAKYPAICGEFVWTGFDYLGEPTPYNSDETNLLNFKNDPTKKAELEKKLEELKKNVPPSRSSYFGIVDLCGFPKDRYYLYQSVWRPEMPMVHILPHWNWEERVGKTTPVHIYTSGDEAELFLNGKSLGRKAKKLGYDFRLVWDSVKYEPGVLKVISYKNGKKWATDVVKTTGVASKLSLSVDRKTILSDGSDLAYITVKVQDVSGLTVPRSHPLLKFEVEGPGEIVATDNGDATSFVPFQSHQREAFNGMALVIVKAKKGASGTFKVKAMSDNLTRAQITIVARNGATQK